MSERPSAEPKMEEILSLLRASHRSLKSRKQALLISLAAATILAGTGALILIETSLYLSAAGKSLIFSVIVLAAASMGFYLSHHLDVSTFKSFYEGYFKNSGESSLFSAVDLTLDENQKKSIFYEAAITSNIELAKTQQLKENLTQFIRNHKISSLYRFAVSFMILSVIALIAIAATMPDESKRALTFWSTFTKPNPFTYTLSPADTTVEHGSSIPFTVQFEEGLPPDDIVMEFKTDIEESFRQRPLLAAGNNLYQTELMSLNSSITYRIVMDEFVSSNFEVNVQHQPRFDELTATVLPPAYTGLPESEFNYPFSQINLVRGSLLEFSGVPSKPVNEAFISMMNEPFHPLKPSADDPDRLIAELQPLSNDTLRFHLADSDGLQNRNPYRILLNVREDQYPVVVVREPTGTVMVNSPELVEILYQATDDFGLTRAQLAWQLQRAFVEQPEQGEINLPDPVNGRNDLYRWDVSGYDLKPRDQLTFRIRVWDNDQFSGYKMGESQPVTIQIPSLAEFFDELDDRERDVESELDQVSDDFSRFGDEYRDFLERLMQNPDGRYEEEQFLEEIRQRQQMIDESVRDVNEKFEQLSDELQQNDRVSDETRQAYRELQQLMQELDDPGLREALEELQRALESISQTELEQALENVEFNETLYMERIERTIELFRSLKMNSDLEKLATQYEDLAERILRDEEGSLERLQSEFQTISEDLDELSEQIHQLDENPPKRAEQRVQQIKEEGLKELENIQRNMENLMDDTSGSMDEGLESPGEEMRNQQNRISEQMRNESNRYRSSIRQMSGQQIQVNIVALQTALYTLLELSDNQEYLTQTSADTRTRSPGYADLARLQKNVNDQFSIVADTLFKVSSELPGVPNRINRKKAEVERSLNLSLESMVERNQRGSVITTRESLGGINDLSSMIASLIDQIQDQQNGGGGGGMSMQQMIEQLQNMSQDQQSLNEELQNFINDRQGDRLTQEQSERLDQIARQQNEIRRQLQELQQRGALNQGDRALSELQRMMEDMEDSINDLRGGITDPIMVERQQNILSRMLSAEQSLQQRGEEEEREGTAAGNLNRVLPPDMTLEELEQEIRSRMQDPNYTRFSDEFQRLIERYFERLRRMER